MVVSKEALALAREIALKVVLDGIKEDVRSPFAKQAILEVLKLTPGVPNVPGGPIYYELLKKVVGVAIELVIISPDGKEVYLTPRDDKYFGKGPHFPGGARVNETSLVSDCDRLAKKELGEDITITGARIIDLEDHWENPPRNHDLCLLVLCEYEGEPQGGEWYAEEPPDLIAYHKSYWPKIASYLRILPQNLIGSFRPGDSRLISW